MTMTTLENLILTAAKARQPITFTYVKPGDASLELRVLLPDEDDPIRTSKDGAKLVIGHDEKRDAPRNFRLDRIREATV